LGFEVGGDFVGVLEGVFDLLLEAVCVVVVGVL
jgi:hypothetical protein